MEKREGAHLWREGRKLLDFSGNDYLGLSQHPAVIEVAKQACADFGTGAVASRLVSGTHALYAPLEAALAAHHRQEAALVFSSGYAANLGVISALLGEGDVIFSDKLAHASMLDGAKLSGATLKRFAHNDIAHARRLLEAERGKYKHALLMGEQIYSMDGDAAPLAALAALACEFDAWLLVDTAHALQPMPDLGALPGLVIIGTLSKSLGSVGGYVAASQSIIDFLVSVARPLIFSTALPPASIAAAQAALCIAQSEPQRAEQGHARAAQLAGLLGLPPPAAAILPIPIGEESKAVQASAALEAAGFAVPAIRPPTVPPGTARLRVSCNAWHSEEDITALAAAIRKERI